MPADTPLFNTLFGTPTATWPPLPLYNKALPGVEELPVLVVSDFTAFPLDFVFDSEMDPSTASGIPIEDRFASTTDAVLISFDVFNNHENDWIKLENVIFYRVERIDFLNPTERTNILEFEGGGGGFYQLFDTEISGALNENDILESSPSPVCRFLYA